ncbi:CAP domain-containing protein [Deinococcus hopiensis]|uniref:PKD domain-containing protein n=1 Tax=Deinococcus hopiensis KR-140 TaxID=695939 RepID=A0A1W1VCE0_9DEIO|nr:CAP domain-containing protein [Deinococcus hopiensis]SMB91032.1 PKD domain-containing protein [Deinococcus hopiensis KR-140]
MGATERRGALLALLLAAAPWEPLVSAQAAAGDFQVRFSMNEDRLAPLEVTFQGGARPEQRVEWDFGDGTAGQGQTQTHTYYRPGTYTVRSTLRTATGQVLSRATGTLEVKSAGSERAQMVVLLGRGEVRFSAAGSVVYRRTTPTFTLNDRPVGAGPVQVVAGEYRASLHLSGEGGNLSRSVRFRMAPLTASVPFETEVLRLTNRARARGWNCTTLKEGGPARAPLTRDSKLEVAALAQSAGMALNDYFDHLSAVDGSTPAARVEAAGVRAEASGENIAAGQATPDEVVRAWLRSPGHCRNIMGDFSHMGVSYVGRPYTKYTHYWTQVFATPAD